MIGLPKIETLEDFCKSSHLSKKIIYFYSKFSDYQYFEFSIPKKSGGERLISQPSKKLKAIQSWILRNILEVLCVSGASKGFKKNESIVQNVEPHLGANSIMSLDLEDFFPSIDSRKVYSIFFTLGYNSLISKILTSLCTYKGALPQGSPCSPYLANLACIRMDNRIQGYVGKKGISYTRYADDLTFSAINPGVLKHSYKTIKKIIESEGFALNKNKTRFMGNSRRKKITGLVVSGEKYGIGRHVYRELRAKIFKLTKTSSEEVDSSKVNHINGWRAYLKGVDKSRLFLVEKYIESLKVKYNGTGVEHL